MIEAIIGTVLMLTQGNIDYETYTNYRTTTTKGKENTEISSMSKLRWSSRISQRWDMQILLQGIRIEADSKPYNLSGMWRTVRSIPFWSLRPLLWKIETTIPETKSASEGNGTKNGWIMSNMQDPDGKNNGVLRYMQQENERKYNILSTSGKGQSIQSLWRLQMCMLWRNGNFIFDTRSHQRSCRENKRSETDGVVFSISQDHQRWIHGTIANPMYELQLGTTNEQWRMSTQERDCAPYIITAYSIEQFGGTTADGTRTPGNAGVIAAGSYNLPFNTYVDVEGLGVYRIADRGRLGARHIDVLMSTTREALIFGRQTRTVCIVD